MKLILITGFLGSGKTTLLKKLLNEYKDSKIGVLMNEFGETSIDGQLIKGADFDLIELTNGSIFCACLKENFIKGLAEFLSHDLEIVFVESSGVADPSNMETILETVTKISDKKYDYAGSICIADGHYFIKQFDVIPAIEKQIFYANEVIIIPIRRFVRFSPFKEAFLRPLWLFTCKRTTAPVDFLRSLSGGKRLRLIFLKEFGIHLQ